MSIIAHRHVPELDGLRAIAVLLVVLFHCAPGGIARGGFIGVDVFFVLSGFLITSILTDERDRVGAIDLRTFYARRMARLAPALLLLLAGYLIAAPWVWPAHDHLLDAALTGFYLSDYSYTFWRLPFYLQHTWSLAVEEQFYLLWPLALPIVAKRPSPVLWLIVFYLAMIGWRLGFAGDWRAYYYRFDTHASGLIAGIILCFALRRLSLRPLHAYLAAAMLILLAATADINRAMLFIPLAEIATALLVGCLVTGQAGAIARPLRSSGATAVGRLSYAIYLWHFPFAYWARNHWGFTATAISTVIFAVTMAVISHVTVEAWGRRLSRALRQKRTAAEGPPLAVPPQGTRGKGPPDEKLRRPPSAVR